VSTRLAIAAGLAVGLALATTAHADDDKPEIQRMLFAEAGDQLTVTMLPPGGLGKLFDAPAYDALGSGLPSQVVIRMTITPVDSDAAIAEYLIERSVNYDVWTEVYRLAIDQPGMPTKKLAVKYRADALTWATTIKDLPIARLSAFPPGRQFVLKMVVELNPVSAETLAEVQRWLRQGNGGGIDRGGAFFGSFVSVFYNPKIAQADRVLRIRSQPFYRQQP
jgi:hypothetical protein